MRKLPKKFLDRVSQRLKTFQDIAASIKSRDVSEADTVTVVKDMLADIFGYDKYLELTSEHQIKGTFCDLAIKLDEKVHFLIEVKSAGLDLNDTHLRQVVNYAANQGIEWVALTNSNHWRLFKIEFAKPISYEEVANFSISDMNAKNEEHLEKMFLLAREGMTSNAIHHYHQQAQLLNRFTVSQIILSEPSLSLIRKELKKVFPDIKVDTDQISGMLSNEILKREVLEGDKAKEAETRIRKAINKINRVKAKETVQLEKTNIISIDNAKATEAA